MSNDSLITVIILTKNEELHIERAIKSALSITKNVIIIDSNSTDDTIFLAQKYNVIIKNASFNNFSEKLNWCIESIEYKTPWIVNNNNKLNNLNLDKISDVVSSNVGNSKTDIIFESDATNFIGGLTNNESVLSNEIVTSSISFVPYDTSSAVDFNPTSLVNYVRQINEIFYMSGSQLTSSRLDYQDELQLKIVGKFSSGIYLDNLDYNIPYRASFLVKNWPFYQYNTSSYWYLPVPINASNTDFRSSKADWVKAELETGGTLIDEYGFSIDF